MKIVLRKSDVVFNPMIQKFNLSILQSTLFVFQIQALFDSLLYTNFIVTLLMPLLIIVQLFIDGLLFILMIITLLSLVVLVVTIDLM
jgi:hypothetical protein